MRVAACQLDLVVGDLDGNVEAMLAALERAEAAGADMAVFPELAVTGYPPEDLLLKPGFVADNRAALEKLAGRTGRCAAVVGFVDAERDLYNAAAVCAQGSVQGVYRKHLLPNYSVFDEQRYFAPAPDELTLFVIGGVRVGVSICEDAWAPTGPVTDQAVVACQRARALEDLGGHPGQPLADGRKVVDAAQVACRDAQHLQALPAAEVVSRPRLPGRRRSAVEIGQHVQGIRIGHAQLGERAARSHHHDE